MLRPSPEGAGHTFARIAPAAPGAGLHDYLGGSMGQGQPLAPDVRASFERSVGHRLDGVRVVADDRAASAADELGARAFTLGSTIWFGRGEYRPADPEGRRLLAHEVAHSVQQRVSGPAIQRELIVGGAADPAEVSADRAADAMVRGARAQISAGGSDAVLRRACRVTASEPGERTIACDDGNSYRVTHRRETGPAAGRVPETRGSARFNWNGRDFGIDFTICRGGTRVVVTPQLRDIPAQALQVMSNALSGAALGQGVSIQPGLQIQLIQSESFEITVEGGPAISGETGRVTGGSGSITIHTRRLPPITLRGQGTRGGGGVFTVEVPLPGEPSPPVPRVDCSTVPPPQPRDVFECRRIIPARPGRPGTPRITRSPSTRIYVLFDYATATIIGWRFEGDSTTYAPGDQAIHDRVMNLILLEGFSPSSITGYTSPEGPRQRRRGSRFEGNIALAQERADAAKAAFFRDVCFACPTFEGRPITPLGIGELYSPEDVRGREVEGRPLAEAAIRDYLAFDELRPSDPEAFRRQSFDQQREQTYRMLRRAEIRLERNPVLVERTEGTRDVPAGLGDRGPCPQEVETVAREAFRLDLLLAPTR